MLAEPRWRSAWIGLISAILLTACGGDNDDSALRQAKQLDRDLIAEPGAPQQVGDTATDALAWFNYRRQQAGLSALARNSVLDTAALDHSIYLRDNNEVSHYQESGKPSFTGVTLADRLDAVDYSFEQPSYAYGEVISAAVTPSGFVAADSLITAIYHRYVVLEPVYNQGGAGSSSKSSGYTWLTGNFAADGLNAGLGTGRFITWPADGLKEVQTEFLTDSEIPDPLPDQNEAGYPISIHADITSRIVVQQFTLRQPGGQILAAELLSSDTDSNTEPSTAALIPLEVLQPATLYEARFIGAVDGIPVDHIWQFTTR